MCWVSLPRSTMLLFGLSLLLLLTVQAAVGQNPPRDNVKHKSPQDQAAALTVETRSPPLRPFPGRRPSSLTSGSTPSPRSSLSTEATAVEHSPSLPPQELHGLTLSSEPLLPLVPNKVVIIGEAEHIVLGYDMEDVPRQWWRLTGTIQYREELLTLKCTANSDIFIDELIAADGLSSIMHLQYRVPRIRIGFGTPDNLYCIGQEMYPKQKSLYQLATCDSIYYSLQQNLDAIRYLFRDSPFKQFLVVDRALDLRAILRYNKPGRAPSDGDREGFYFGVRDATLLQQGIFRQDDQQEYDAHRVDLSLQTIYLDRQRDTRTAVKTDTENAYYNPIRRRLVQLPKGDYNANILSALRSEGDYSRVMPSHQRSRQGSLRSVIPNYEPYRYSAVYYEMSTPGPLSGQSHKYGLTEHHPSRSIGLYASSLTDPTLPKRRSQFSIGRLTSAIKRALFY